MAFSSDIYNQSIPAFNITCWLLYLILQDASVAEYYYN